jgi:hypothetical protein
MAHGNFSDMVFLALFIVAVQWLGFPSTLYQDFGPLKAQFSVSHSAEMAGIITLGGGMLLMLAMTFSGVKWNPINGKMAGIGIFITSAVTVYTQFKADSDVFVPRFFYVYAAVLFLGGLHIFAFPSNPLPPKTPETKNNHGNFSDLIALCLIAAALSCYFTPDYLFKEFGPFKAQFPEKSADLDAMIKFTAGEMLIIALMLSGVKWNPINGKMAGLGGLIGAGYTNHVVFKADGVFVPHVVYVYTSFILLGAIHVMFFPSNALPPKESKEE